jgi:hypothetical protein
MCYRLWKFVVASHDELWGFDFEKMLIFACE